MEQKENDEEWMRRAIQCGEKGRITAPPNPWVGVVIRTSDNVCVSEGYHERAGCAHAEVVALSKLREQKERKFHDLCLYTTLSPCGHFGRTPPCVHELISCKMISRVVIGLLDPDEISVCTLGLERLRASGIEVVVGVLEQEVAWSLRAYLWHRKTRYFPYLVAKLGLSLDDCYSYLYDELRNEPKNSNSSEFRWITSEVARADAHEERARSQKIVIGKGTAERDRPSLTVRYNCLPEGVYQPEPIVSTRDLAWLAPDEKTLQILVEGGPCLINDLLERGLLNELLIYRSSRILGLSGSRWVPSVNLEEWRRVESRLLSDGTSVERFVRACPEDISRVLKFESLVECKPQSTRDESSDVERISRVISALNTGEPIVVFDNEDRENEGDLMILANKITEKSLKLMLEHGTGIVCAVLTATRAKLLKLPPMVIDLENTDVHRTKFTISVDSNAVGVTTGVSCHDRLKTLQELGSPLSSPLNFNRPGHIFPLIAAGGGLLERQGHTEAGLELARLAGADPPVMVISELYDKTTGKMMTRKQCQQLGLESITISQLQSYLCQKLSWVTIPLSVTDSSSESFQDWRVTMLPGGWKVLLSNVAASSLEDRRKSHRRDHELRLWIRVHSQCWTSEVIGSVLCDCSAQLKATLNLISGSKVELSADSLENLSKSETPRGGIILFPPDHEGRGLGLLQKLKAYALQQSVTEGSRVDTFEANRMLGFSDDARSYMGLECILETLGLSSADHLHVITNNPHKLEEFRKSKFKKIHQVTLNPEGISSACQNYLRVKHAWFSRETLSLPAHE